jgi:pyruvate/2-oxoglutarate dehydrogenase complex dihydrolipoamide acyltransferase (E2) component
MAQQKYILVSGSANVNNGAATAAVIAAPGAAKLNRLTAGIISVTVAATGGSGRITLKDGTNVIQSWDANSITNYQFNYGENVGYPLSANNALNLVAEGAGANQATAYASCVGYTVG